MLPPFSRRTFLQASAGALGHAYLAGAGPVDGPEEDDGLLLSPDTEPARVVVGRSAFAVNGPSVHPSMLRELLEVCLTDLTYTESLEKAWRSLFTSDDIICLKFNRSGQYELGTTRTMAPLLVSSLVESGFKKSRIVCVEAPSGLDELAETLSPAYGYGARETDFTSGRDQLSSVLDQATAIINVPYLKTHNLAGITCSLKNLSHGLVKHPARLHANGCAPYIADINLLPAIRRKLRLCLVDALRVVYRDGPDATSDNMSDEGVIFASTDPVAADSIGLGLVNEVRARRGLGAVAATPGRLSYLADAHRKGLGVAAPHGIELINHRLS